MREPGEAFGTHVGDVDVAHAAAGGFVNTVDVAAHPLEMAQRIFIVKGFDNDLAGRFGGAGGSDGKLGEHAGFSGEERLDVGDGVGGDAVDGGDDVAGLNACAGLGQRGDEFLGVGSALEDGVDAVAAFHAADVGAEQTHGDAGRFGFLAGIYVGVAAGKLGYHLADEVVEVEASLYPGKQGGVFVVDGFPVYTVHVFEIEAVAVGTPGLVENLRPLGGIVDDGNHVGEVDGFFELHFRCREGAGVYFFTYYI